MYSAVTALALSLPAALACVAQPGIPEATETITNSEPIEVASGECLTGAMPVTTAEPVPVGSRKREVINYLFLHPR